MEKLSSQLRAENMLELKCYFNRISLCFRSNKVILLHFQLELCWRGRPHRLRLHSLSKYLTWLLAYYLLIIVVISENSILKDCNKLHKWTHSMITGISAWYQWCVEEDFTRFWVWSSVSISVCKKMSFNISKKNIIYLNVKSLKVSTKYIYFKILGEFQYLVKPRETPLFPHYHHHPHTPDMKGNFQFQATLSLSIFKKTQMNVDTVNNVH